MILRPVLALLMVASSAAMSLSQASAAEPKDGAAAATTEAEVVLTPEEKAEKEARRACKVALCKGLHAKDANAGTVACHVVKSWRQEQMVKLVGKLKVKWPYEGVHCATDVSVKGSDLAKAMSEPKAELALDKHTVTCSVARKEQDATEFKFELSPKIKFENGKAASAHANWGKIEAPTLIKSALWTATAADNTVNILSSTIVEEVNEFASKKCDEVKDEWASKR